MGKTLVLIDFQREFETEGRPYYIKSIAPSVDRAKKVLKFARNNNWDIIHVQHIQPGEIFTLDNEYSKRIKGFEPKENEIECTKSRFSCFTSEKFSKVMSERKANEIYVMGFMSNLCCYTTILDGNDRKFNMHFISDASNARAGKKFGEQSTHEHAVDIMSAFAKIHSAEEVVKQKLQITTSNHFQPAKSMEVEKAEFVDKQSSKGFI